MKFNKFENNSKQIVGMIHLPPLLSYPGFPGINKCIEVALSDLEALEKAGFDGALLENENDKPHTEFANDSQITTFTKIAKEVVSRAKIPIGVQVMLNDWKASFDIAKAVGAVFTRLDVFVDNVTSKWGRIIPDPRAIFAYKNNVYPELVFLTDIQVKHKRMLEKKDLLTSAEQAIQYGSSGLVITGEATGTEAKMEDVIKVKNKFPNIPVWIGSGIDLSNVKKSLSIADGAIVGTSLKTNNRIDPKKAKQLTRLMRSS